MPRPSCCVNAFCNHLIARLWGSTKRAQSDQRKNPLRHFYHWEDHFTIDHFVRSERTVFTINRHHFVWSERTVFTINGKNGPLWSHKVMLTLKKRGYRLSSIELGCSILAVTWLRHDCTCVCCLVCQTCPHSQEYWFFALAMWGQYCFPKTRYFCLFPLERSLFSRDPSRWHCVLSSCY